MLSQAQTTYLERVGASLATKALTRPALESMGRDLGITDRQVVKELTELAIVRQARAYAQGLYYGEHARDVYQQIVGLYERQPNLSLRTSESVLLQQYSTAAPLAWLAGWFAFDQKAYGPKSKQHTTFFEPSAGNGMLTLAAPSWHVGTVNEIDSTRRRHLHELGYRTVLGQDATLPFEHLGHFDAILTNPPFGSCDPFEVDGYKITSLEHAMALNALVHMKDHGRAAIIIGGHTEYDEKGRIQAGKNRIFFNLLHKHYHVVDTINVDGKKLYSRMGTGFNVRLILIAGRKTTPDGFAPLRTVHDVVEHSFESLFARVERAVSIARRAGPTAPGLTPKPTNDSAMRLMEMEAEALSLELDLLALDLDQLGLGMPYRPSSNACIVLNTDVPDAMGSETHAALRRVKQAVGGDFDVFVADRLGYADPMALCKALSAEQVDAVALAIYNIEARHEGMIVGDQTGIGKGRVAAAMIRYAVAQGYTPVFLTEKPNLFSDLYRDLTAIGSAHLRPFIVNGKEDASSVKDEDGKVVYTALDPSRQKSVIASQKVPKEFDYVMATYSQLNAGAGSPKQAFIRAVAADTVLIMDEAHNTSGTSNTGAFMQGVAAGAAGVLFLSATFAKRPDNMPIYAAATAMRETGLPPEDLIGAIADGGVALQEVISAQLVDEGQMLRRERHLENMEVNYLVLDEKEQEHRAVADNITALMRGIVAFQEEHVNKAIKEMDDVLAQQGKQAGERKGTKGAGVDNTPYFSKIFQVVNQMLFSIKAKDVADRAILRLKEGKKPVIAFSSTMGSFLEELTNDNGLPVGPGDVIPADFNTVMRRGLEGVLRYSVTDLEGKTEKRKFQYGDLNNAAQSAYDDLHDLIRKTTAGISLSPIDVIIGQLKRAGYSVAEVTGRKYEVVMAANGKTGTIQNRKKENVSDAFRKFNDNEVDVLLINQSGSTGASAHALPTKKVPAAKVKQRVMIVLQAELDINREVQKRGRINRTGQILPPIFDYVSSAIPAEKRLMMMLRKKLKSLDANTSSNQKNSAAMMAGEDFLNKYGDFVVTEYLGENPELVSALGLDKAGRGESEEKDNRSFEAHKVSGRIAVMPTEVQAQFYDEINQRYNDLVSYLIESGEYDLELEAQNLDAVTLQSEVISVGNGGRSAFGGDVMLEKVEINALRKPLTADEMYNELTAALGGRSFIEVGRELEKQMRAFFQGLMAQAEIDAAAWVHVQKEAVKGDKDEKDLLLKITDAGKERLTRAKKQIAAKYEYMYSFLSNSTEQSTPFRIGYDVLIPTGKDTAVTGTFLGFSVNLNQKNPWVPSKIKLRVVVPTSLKRLNIPLSMPAARELKPLNSQTVARTWGELVKDRQTDRTVAYIVTGNLLKGLAENSGRLISYTTRDGGVKKGILKPDGWEPGSDGAAKPVMVPVSGASKTLLSLPVGQMLETNVGLTFMRQFYGFKVLVPATKKDGGALFLDRSLFELVENQRFEKVADRMTAKLEEENLGAFLQVLALKHGATLAVSREEGEKFRAAKSTAQGDVKIPTLPAQTGKANANSSSARERELLEMEAEALLLELELLELDIDTLTF